MENLNPGTAYTFTLTSVFMNLPSLSVQTTEGKVYGDLTPFYFDTIH